MTAELTWVEGEVRTVEAEALADVLAEAAKSATQPVGVVLRAEGAEIHLVVGEPAGTVLVYFPPSSVGHGVGSLHSVGDPVAAKADAWEPPLTAYYFGHHTEFPRWPVVDHETGELALSQFCEQPKEPPPAVLWAAD